MSTRPYASPPVLTEADRSALRAVSAPAIELIGVRAGYGRIEVLHGLDLTVPVGTLFALLGPNGSGKTTTLKLIDGRLQPDRGCVHIAGSHVNRVGADSLARAGVCSIPEGRGVFPNLTVAENLRLIRTSRPDLAVKEIEDRVFDRFPMLAERRRQVAGTMSGGQQQMLAMARAVVVEPAVLLVDELSMGLAPMVVAELYDTLGQLAADGMTVLLVEQFAHTALAIADLAAIMVHGELTFIGEPSEMDDVLDAYLGAAQ